MHFDGGAGWRMVAWRLDKKKIWPHLSDAKALAVQEQPHPHQRRVSTVGADDFHVARA